MLKNRQENGTLLSTSHKVNLNSRMKVQKKKKRLS